MNKRLKKGTKVLYRPLFGFGPQTEVTILSIDRCERKGSKYGKEVNSIPFKDKDYGVYDLDNGHWCYGDQIDAIV